MRCCLTTGLTLAAILGCSDGGPIAPHQSFDFTIVAPTQIGSKAVVEIEARITDLDQAVYPLTFRFEKANAGQDFVVVAEIVLHAPEARVARAAIPILMDPQIRVTGRESSDRHITVSKTVQIDVLDFP